MKIRIENAAQARGYLKEKNDVGGAGLGDVEVMAYLAKKYPDLDVAQGGNSNASGERTDAAPRVERVERVTREDAPARPQTPRRRAFDAYDRAFHDRSRSHLDPSAQPAAPTERADAAPTPYDPFAKLHAAFNASRKGAPRG